MKRVLLSLVVCLIASFSSKGENMPQENVPADRNHWTVTVAYDCVMPGKWTSPVEKSRLFRSGLGLSIGADYCYLLPKNFFLEPGARLFLDNYKYNNFTIGEGTSENPAKTYDPPVRKSGLRIPLTAGYKLDILTRGSVLFSTGIELVIGFTAHVDVDDDQKDIFEENLYKSDMRRFDLAWKIRGSIIIERFRVDISGGLGMLDIIKGSAKMQENYLSFGLGYLF